jgi:hypothetical protein
MDNTYDSLFTKLRNLQSKKNDPQGKYSFSHFRLHADGSGRLLSKDEVLLGRFNSLAGAHKLLDRLISEQSQTIVKVGSYDGRVSSKGVQVGCTLVTFDELDKVVEASKKYRNVSRVGQKVPFREVRIGEKVQFWDTSPVYTRIEAPKDSPSDTITFIKRGETVQAACSPDHADLVTIVG